jgi:hypothetical protein
MYPANKLVSRFSEDQPPVREYILTFSEKQSIRIVIQQEQIKQHISLEFMSAVSLECLFTICVQCSLRKTVLFQIQ